MNGEERVVSDAMAQEWRRLTSTTSEDPEPRGIPEPADSWHNIAISPTTLPGRPFYQ